MPVNSKQKQLSIPEVITTAIKDLRTEQRMVAPAMLAFIQEAHMPDADLFQAGNTVFISHVKEKNGLKVAYMRALNADTARNYLDNGIEYTKHIVKAGVTYVFMTFKESSVTTIFNAIARPEVQAKVGKKAKTAIKKAGNGVYVGVIRILEDGEE